MVIYGIGGVFALAPIIAIAPSVQLAVIAILAAVGGVVASARLVTYEFARVAEPAHARQIPGRLTAIAVASAILAVTAMLFIDTAQFPHGGPTSWFERDTTWFATPAVVVGAVAGTMFRRHRVLAVLGGSLAAIGVAAGTQFVLTGGIVGPWIAVEGGMVAGIGLTIVYGLRDWEAAMRLDQAHRLEAQLAVADERLRFAADLHDIQGHHLEVIALKSELAARLAHTDPAATSGHLAEIREQARTALAETREVVQGYRQTPLADELANATRVLAAAGIDGRLDHGVAAAAGAIGEPGRQLLGLVVREATTNILRHSHAGKATLALDLDGHHARLVIRNDGATEDTGPAGTGLHTLAQRLTAAHGALDWAREGEWFTLTALVPVASEQPA